MESAVLKFFALHPVAASAILDLSNYLTRKAKLINIQLRPVDQLEQLLKGVVTS